MNEPNRAAPPAPEQPALSVAAYDESWLGSLLRPLLIIVLIICMTAVFVAFLRLVVAQWGPMILWTLAGLGILAGTIGCLTTTWLALPNQRLRRSVTYRVAEFVLIVLFARVVLWAVAGQVPALEAVLTQPTEVFFDWPFVIAVLIMLFTWLNGSDFTDDLAQLALQQDEIHLAQLAASGLQGVHDTTRAAQSDRASLLRQFVVRWVIWGLVLIALAAALRMGVNREQFWTLMHQDVDPLAVGAIIIYFLAGLLLISQGQLAVLRARWTTERMPTSPSIQRNWPIYTAIVVGVFGLIAALLPLGDTVLISAVLSALLNTLFTLFTTLFQLLSLLLIMLLSLLPFSRQAIPPPPPAQAAAAAPPPMPLAEVPPWVGGMIFWLIITLVLMAAAYFYFADRKTGFSWLRRFAAMLRLRWLQIWGGWESWRAAQRFGSAGAKAGAPGSAGASRRRFWPWRWQALDPTQRVRYLYFQLLDQAEEHDLPRRPAETPAAFAPRLHDALAGAACGAAFGAACTSTGTRSRPSPTRLCACGMRARLQMTRRLRSWRRSGNGCGNGLRRDNGSSGCGQGSGRLPRCQRGDSSLDATRMLLLRTRSE